MPRPVTAKLPETPELAAWIACERRSPVDVWVTPNRVVKMALPTTRPPKYALCRVLAQAGGYVLHPVTLNPCVRKTPELCRRLGLDISDETLDRLIEAGFVAAQKPTPFTILVDLESLWEHLEASSMPGFWNRDRRLAYMSALDRETERREEQRELQKARSDEASERSSRRKLKSPQPYKRKEQQNDEDSGSAMD